MIWLMDVPGLWILLILAFYGLVCAANQGVRVFRRRPGFMAAENAAPLNLVVLVRNQAEQVEGFVRNLQNLRPWARAGVEWECFLVDVDSTDETPLILERLAREEVHIHFVHLPAAQANQVLDAVLMLSRGGVCLLADFQAPASGRALLHRLENHWK